METVLEIVDAFDAPPSPLRVAAAKVAARQCGRRNLPIPLAWVVVAGAA